MLAIVSRVAGLDLIPACDYEIGHINLAPAPASGAGPPRPVVDTHLDAYLFVAIVMLSDPAPPTSGGGGGGETLVRTRPGPDLAIRSPARGHAVVLQGGRVPHAARPAAGGAERITMVTSFRPRDPGVPMGVRLATVRPVSDLRRLYGEYVGYRLEALAERVARQRARVAAMGPAGFDTEKVRAGLWELKDMVERTARELVDEESITMGEIVV